MISQASRLREFIQAPHRTQGSGHAGARVVSFLSGKGGVGKTNLVLNLGIAFSQVGLRVLIVDDDSRAANVDTLSGVAFPGSLLRVGAGEQTLREAVAAGPAGVDLIPAYDPDDGTARRNAPRGRDEIRYAFLLARAGYDWILIDAGPGLSGSALEFTLLSDEVSILTTGEPTALRRTYALVKQLLRHDALVPADMSMRLIVNGVTSAEEAGATVRKLNIAIGHFLGCTLPGAGWLPRDACIPDAVCRQQPFLLAYPASRASRCVRGMVDRMTAHVRRTA